jgi:hypothetical protein
MKKNFGIDKNGAKVEIDDLVQLSKIRPSIIKRLFGSELHDVASMLGKQLKVFDVYDDGLVWVSLSWERGDGQTEIHAIAVDQDAIDLVKKSAKSDED